MTWEERWDRIIQEQRDIQGPVVSALINDVAELTDGMSGYELDLLEE